MINCTEVITITIATTTLTLPNWGFSKMDEFVTLDQDGGGGGVGGGRGRRGLELRNNVLTTCKAVTLHGGQRIIAVFFPQ